MKKSELINLLYSYEEDEVFIEIEDFEWDIKLEQREQIFDGFDEVYPAHLVIKKKIV